MSMTQEQINVDLFYRCKQLEAELATLQAKAKAYDEGQHEWGMFDTEGKFAVTCPNEQKYLANGWTCRKVRVCKEVDE
jgi:hypothetical protein